MKIYVINALKFVLFNFFKEYFLNLICLKSAPEILVTRPFFINHKFWSHIFYTPCRFFQYFYRANVWKLWTIFFFKKLWFWL